MKKPITPMHVFIRELYKQKWLDKILIYELVNEVVKKRGDVEDLIQIFIDKNLLNSDQLQHLMIKVEQFFQSQAPSILVIDDDDDLLALITAILEQNYNVATADNGKEALEKLEQGLLPELIISDVNMPEMDGWRFVRKIRSTSDFAFIPVIFLTSLGSREDKIRGFQLGVDEYLTKPFNTEELFICVNRVLKQYKKVGNELVAQICGDSPEEAIGLKGNLEEMGLCGILTLLEMEKKEGRLTIVRANTGSVGELFLKEGKVVRTAVLDKSGQQLPITEEDVCFELFNWVKGTFEFRNQKLSIDYTVDLPITHILLEVARKMDETRRISQKDINLGGEFLP